MAKLITRELLEKPLAHVDLIFKSISVIASRYRLDVPSEMGGVITNGIPCQAWLAMKIASAMPMRRLARTGPRMTLPTAEA